ncbi:MAG: translation elongation factor Ts [Campylobacterota bacterium]
MAIKASDVKALREMTGAGMMACKKALTEAQGDQDKAVELLRKKGLSAAAKKADRVAAEGTITVTISKDNHKATITEINAETDFVAKNDNFKDFAKDTSDHIHDQDASTVDELHETTINGEKFSDYLSTQIAKIGENIVVQRFHTLETGEKGCVGGYLHQNGRVGVIVAAECDSGETSKAVAEALKDVAMHAAAMNPQYINPEAVPEDVIAKEEEIAKEQLKKEGKPEKIWDKILPGKINKYYKDNTLEKQPFVKDDKVSVGEFLDSVAKQAGGSAKLVQFVRYELGENVEKKQDDFAAEVAAELGQ